MARYARRFPPKPPTFTLEPPVTAIAGVVATVSVVAPVPSLGDGTGSIIAFGTPAQVNVAAPAGTVNAQVPGTIANVAVAGVGGTGSVNVIGTVAQVNVAAPAGTVTAGVPFLAAQPFVVRQDISRAVRPRPPHTFVIKPKIAPITTVTGTTATVNVAALSGTVSAAVPGATAQVQVAAPSGSGSVTAPGTAAAVNVAAPSGTGSMAVPGVTALVNVAGQPGGISTVPVTTVPGTVANVTVAGVAGSIPVSVAGVIGQVTVAGQAGTPSSAVQGITAQVNIAGIAGTVTVTVPGTPGQVNVAAFGTGSVAVPGNTAQVAVAAFGGRVLAGVNFPGFVNVSDFLVNAAGLSNSAPAAKIGNSAVDSLILQDSQVGGAAAQNAATGEISLENSL